MAANAKKPTVKKPVANKEIVQEQEIINAPKKQEPAKPSWEIKDRMYFVKGQAPLTYTISARHSRKNPLLYFDKEQGMQRELRYATNQNSPFADEQKGQSTLGHIMFKDGALFVKKEQQNLQKLLSLYHPLLNKKYYEHNPVAIAEDELEDLNVQVDAMMAARTMDVDDAEAILRVELGSKVSSMTTKELKRDLMLFAKKKPDLFMELANDDNVQLRNIAIKASEAGIIKLSQDQRTFTWGSNGRKLMTVPFDENPYSAMAAYFKTDEGVEVYRSVEKNLE
jgi:hypothetical protein